MSRRILYVQYTNPAGYPPLEHSSRLLAGHGWDVLFLGTGADGAADRFEFPPHPRIRVRRLPFTRPGWRQKLHFLWFHAWTLGWAICSRVQWIYASDLMACPIGWLCTFLPGTRVIYHEHDRPAQEAVGIGRPSVFSRFLLQTRRSLARRADLCILPNQRRVEAFRQSTGRTGSIECVWNCPSLGEAQLTRADEHPCGLVVFYHGSIVPARVPLALVRALALLPDNVRLEIAGYETEGAKGYAARLQEEARRLKLEHRFEYLGARSRFELLPLSRGAHVGLAFVPLAGDDLNEQAMTGASNKPFEYLANGLALLMSDLPDWRALFAKPGYGLTCDPEDPESVAAALRWFLEHPEETRTMGQQGCRQIADEWNYERQFKPVLDHLMKDSSAKPDGAGSTGLAR